MACRICQTPLTDANWYPSNKRDNRKICNDCCKGGNAEYKKTHPEEAKRWRWNVRHKLKLEVLSHYSYGTFACLGDDGKGCPFNVDLKHFPLAILMMVETIDHIHNNGAEERERIFGKRRGKGGDLFYRWLRDHKYPEGYQVLCFNCQWIKQLKHIYLTS